MTALSEVDQGTAPTRRRTIGPRGVWARDGYAHITAGEIASADEATLLEETIQGGDHVEWAAYNGVLGRVVVRFDQTRTTVAEIVRMVERAERRTVRPDRAARLPDLDPTVANILALVADLIGSGLGLFGRTLRLPTLPAEFAAMPAAIDLVPGVDRRLRSLFGPANTDLGMAVVSSAIGAATRTSTTSITDAALRVVLLAEASANHQAWASRAKDLHPDPESSRAESLASPTRPTALVDGPIEQYARRLSTIALVAAGGLLALPGGRRRVAQALAVGSPQAARVGREAYAGGLGRLLAHRGVVVRDPSALRRLDRLNTVVIDASVLVTGRTVIRDVIPIADTEVDGRAQVARLLDAASTVGNRLSLPIRRDGWTLRAQSSRDAAIPQYPDAPWRADGPAGGTVLILTRGRRRVARVRVESDLDPLAAALISAARKVGRVLISGAPPGLAERVGADGTVRGGPLLAASVRTLQRESGGVALLASRNDVALATADCGIGILTTAERRPPWGAHLLAGPGLEPAWLILESAGVASRVSKRSARIALAAPIAGALITLLDRTPQATRRVLTASSATRLASLVSGAWSAYALGRIPPPVPEGFVPWHALPVDEVLRLLDTTPRGLTDEDAAQRRVLGHPRDGDERGLLPAVVADLNTPLTAPLASGAGISAVTGSTTDAVLVMSVILSNALLSAGQKLTAGRASRRLLSAVATQARLHRGDETRLVPADDLVPGDVVVLKSGDAVPADCRLLTATDLEVDESTLTGESAPVVKNTTPTLAPAVADRTNMVYAGTTVVAGTANAVVVATAKSTEAGRGAAMVMEDGETGGVQARLRSMTAASIPVSAAAAAALMLSGIVRGRFVESITSATALAVAAIPEGLPFVATAAELSASRRLAQHNILVRNPRAMEALGRVDVVCFDKTGTLTEGNIRLRAVSDGASHRHIEDADPACKQVIAAALRATPIPADGEILPHPTDRAVVDGAKDAGVAITDGASGWRIVRELPFESDRGFHAVLGETAGSHMISVKGAPEAVLSRCVSRSRHGHVRPLSNIRRREIEAEVDRLAQQGLRVLAIAERTASGRGHLDDERVERLELRGLLGLADTTRPTAAEAIRRLRRAGVEVVMITGDHPSTAAAIAAELGLLASGDVVTGSDLDDADDAGVDALVSKASVFARTSPAHKVAVVRSLRRAGRVVAVTGDGANDAPAIRLADVGIALGDEGTAAARRAADMIVLDSRIETIADGVIAGRAMWASVRDAVSLLVGGNLGEILFTVASSAISVRPPLNTRQILFVNLMTDLIPAMVVASRAPRGLTPESLAREGPDQSLGSALNLAVAQRAVATALATTGGWLIARATGTTGRANTVAVASLVASQLAQTATAARGDPAVLAAVGLSFAALVGTLQTPGLSHFFGSRPLGPVAWGTVLGAAVAGGVIGAIPADRLSGIASTAQRLLTRRVRATTRNESQQGRRG